MRPSIWLRRVSECTIGAPERAYRPLPIGTQVSEQMRKDGWGQEKGGLLSRMLGSGFPATTHDVYVQHAPRNSTLILRRSKMDVRRYDPKEQRTKEEEKEQGLKTCLAWRSALEERCACVT